MASGVNNNNNNHAAILNNAQKANEGKRFLADKPTNRINNVLFPHANKTQLQQIATKIQAGTPLSSDEITLWQPIEKAAGLKKPGLSPEIKNARIEYIHTVLTTQTVALEKGTYQGPLDSSGRPHGRGTLTYKNDATYVGEFKKGQRHGLGVYQSSNMKLDGAFKNDKFDNGEREYLDNQVHSTITAVPVSSTPYAETEASSTRPPSVNGDGDS